MADNRKHEWTSERMDLLRRRWAEGHQASQIAKELGGVTRNAVIGKVHRLGLAGRAGPSRPPPTRRQIRDRARAARQETASPVYPFSIKPATAAQKQAGRAAFADALDASRALTPLLIDGAAVGVLGLRARMCRFPIGEVRAEGFGFCARAAGGEGPYCPDHHALAYRPGAPTKRQQRDIAGMARRCDATTAHKAAERLELGL